jgi:hypothetical protein
MRFPNTLVELKAIPAVIIIPRKLSICPFVDLSIGSDSISARVPKRTIKNEIVFFMIFLSVEADWNLLNTREFKVIRIIIISNIPAGSSNDSRILNNFSIINKFFMMSQNIF